jgi:threonine dehydratase
MRRTSPPSVMDIYDARRRLRPYLPSTPLLSSAWLSSASGASVFLKIESLQLGRSFKIRGAINAALLARERTAGAPPAIVTASAGNHGRGIAIAAQQLGLRAIVFTPSTAPETKKAGIRWHGAELRDEAPDYDAAEEAARVFAAAQDAVFISPYNDTDVIAGAGTIALEILQTMPSLAAVVVPLGGGGLASGIGTALKSIAPHVTIVGVEVQASTPFATGLAAGTITRVDVRPSLADGLVGNLEPGSMTFDLVRRHVDRLVTVSEDELCRAVRGLVEEEQLVAEGAGAAATAAVLARDIVPRDQPAAVLLTGGNIDLSKLIAVLGN